MVYKIVNGAIPSGDEWMSNHLVSLKAAGHNFVRQLQDRSVDLYADSGMFAEAFIDATGRQDTVDTTNTTATFNTDRYEFIELDVSGSTYDPNGFTDVANAFDGESSTSATKTHSGSVSLGKIYASTIYIDKLKITGSSYISSAGSGFSSGSSMELEVTYDGSTWVFKAILNSQQQGGSNASLTVSYDDEFPLEDSVRGYRVVCKAASSQATTKTVTINRLDAYIPAEKVIKCTLDETINTSTGLFVDKVSTNKGDGTDTFRLSTDNFTNYFHIVCDKYDKSILEANGCKVVDVSDGFLIYAPSTLTSEQQKARLINTLFNYSNSTSNTYYPLADARILSACSNVTAIETTWASDVGKQVAGMTVRSEPQSFPTMTSQITFTDTSTTDLQYWYFIDVDPESTVSISFTDSSTTYNSSGNTYSTDTSGSILSGESGVTITADSYTSASRDCEAFITMLFSGGVSTLTSNSNYGADSMKNIDFNAMGIPNFTSMTYTYTPVTSSWYSMGSVVTVQETFTEKPSHIEIKHTPSSDSINVEKMVGFYVFE